jgi:hypothetical protein
MSNGFAPMTPLEAYEQADYHYPVVEIREALRIPIAGPRPYNTLAVLQTLVPLTKYWDFGETSLYRDTLVTGTSLQINGHDPHSDPPVMQSSCASIRMMQIKTGSDPGSVGNIDFVAAVDQIAEETLVDAQGHLMLSIDVASFMPGALAVAMAEVTSWVLFFEAEPPTPPTDPQLAADRLAADALASRAPQLLNGYRIYISTPDPDLPRAATEVAGISSQLAGFWTVFAAQAQSIAVDAWRAYAAPADGQLDYLMSFTEARHNLIFRLTENAQTAEATALGPQTIDGYRSCAALPGADLIRIAVDLRDLSKELSGYDHADALDAAQASVDSLRALTSPDDVANRLILLAEALQDLAGRLIDVGRAADGAALVPESLSRYREYLAQSEADRARVKTDLDQYETTLEGAGLDDAAATVAQLDSSLS